MGQGAERDIFAFVEPLTNIKSGFKANEEFTKGQLLCLLSERRSMYLCIHPRIAFPIAIYLGFDCFPDGVSAVHVENTGCIVKKTIGEKCVDAARGEMRGRGEMG